jgi:Ca2+-binding EF-hand superfamily protein
MHRLIPYLLTGFVVIFLPQNLLAEDPAGQQGSPHAQPARPNPEILFNRLDANHDGFITQDELPPAMPEMFKELLFLADSNGDGKITLTELTDALNQHRPGPGSESSPFGRRFRGLEGQSGQIPGPPFGRRFGGPEGRPGEMAGPPFRGPGEEPPQNLAGAGGPEGSVRVEVYQVNPTADPQATLKALQTLLAGQPDVRMDVIPNTNKLIVLARPAEHATIRATLEKMQHDAQGGADAKEKPTVMAGPPFGRPGGQPGWMARQGFGEQGSKPGWMGWPPFGRPGPGPDFMAEPPFGRGGPVGKFPQMAGPNFPGPNAGPHWMGEPSFNGPEGRLWAEQGYGPPHRWATFGQEQERPWQQVGHWGQPNRPWQADFERSDRPWMAYGAMPQRPRTQYGQNWYRRLLSYNERPRGLVSKLQAIFDRLDTNHDHQLSFEEFSRGMKHLLRAILPGRGPQREQMAGMFGRQDFGPWARQDFGPPGKQGLGPWARTGFGPQGRNDFGPPGREKTE